MPSGSASLSASRRSGGSFTRATVPKVLDRMSPADTRSLVVGSRGSNDQSAKKANRPEAVFRRGACSDGSLDEADPSCCKSRETLADSSSSTAFDAPRSALVEAAARGVSTSEPTAAGTEIVFAVPSPNASALFLQDTYWVTTDWSALLSGAASLDGGMRSI